MIVFGAGSLLDRIALLMFILFSFSVSAQDQGDSSEGVVQAEILSLKIAEVEASTSLDEQTVNNLVELYRKSLTNLELVRSEKQSTNDFAKEAESAEDEIPKIV